MSILSKKIGLGCPVSRRHLPASLLIPPTRLVKARKGDGGSLDEGGWHPRQKAFFLRRAKPIQNPIQQTLNQPLNPCFRKPNSPKAKPIFTPIISQKTGFSI
jgi:hypothetical protein